MNVDNVKNLLSIIKELFLTIKEAALVILIGLLLCLPGCIKEKLAALGFKELSTPWGTVAIEQKEATKMLAQETSNTKSEIANTIASFDSIKPVLVQTLGQEKVSEISKKLMVVENQVNEADKKVRNSLLEQETLIENTNTIPKENNVGWIYLGKATTSKRQWVNKAECKESLDDLKLNSKLTLNDNVYLRSGEQDRSSDFSALPIKKVLQKAESYVLTDLRFSKAPDGNFYVWGYVNEN